MSLLIRPSAGNACFCKQQGGFTLLELLAVVIIVALLATTVQLTRAGGSPQQRLADQAEPLLRVFELQCRQARLVNSDRGISLLEDGWFALERGADGQWQADQRGGSFRPRTLPADISWQLLRDGRPVRLRDTPGEPPEAHIRCRPGGWTEHWQLSLSVEGENRQLQLFSEGDGRVQVRESS